MGGCGLWFVTGRAGGRASMCRLCLALKGEVGRMPLGGNFGLFLLGESPAALQIWSPCLFPCLLLALPAPDPAAAHPTLPCSAACRRRAVRGALPLHPLCHPGLRQWQRPHVRRHLRWVGAACGWGGWLGFSLSGRVGCSSLVGGGFLGGLWGGVGGAGAAWFLCCGSGSGSRLECLLLAGVFSLQIFSFGPGLQGSAWESWRRMLAGSP